MDFWNIGIITSTRIQQLATPTGRTGLCFPLRPTSGHQRQKRHLGAPITVTVSHLQHLTALHLVCHPRSRYSPPRENNTPCPPASTSCSRIWLRWATRRGRLERPAGAQHHRSHRGQSTGGARNPAVMITTTAMSTTHPLVRHLNYLSPTKPLATNSPGGGCSHVLLQKSTLASTSIASTAL